jgi:serine/threonine-protein kinase
MNDPERIGRYEISRRLGEGGMGVVYLATDPHLRRPVAIKMLAGHGTYDAELRARFAREAQSAAALRHPSIVTVYDVGEDGNRPFIAMEFLDGESMSELIRREAPVDVATKIRWMVELCDALGYAHERGIIHRDIKPANLMITAEGRLKILDFGLARVAASLNERGLTQAGAIVGTPHYMSPEQVLGKTLDPRSDIFSVGAVLYEILTSRQAFGAETPHLVLHRILQAEPEPIADLAPDLAPAFGGIVARALDKDRDRRYQSLAEMAADLSGAETSLRTGSAATVKLGGPPPISARTVITTTSAAPRREVPLESAATVLLAPGAVPASDTAAPRDRRSPSRVPLFVAVAVVAAIAIAYAVFALSRPGSGTHETSTSVMTPAPTPTSPPVQPAASTSPSPAPTTATVPASVGQATPLPSPSPSSPINGASPRATATPPPGAGRATPGKPAATVDPEVARKCKELLSEKGLGNPLSPANEEFWNQHCRK